MIPALRDCNREADHFDTPEYAIRPLIPYIPDDIRTVWECTDWTGKSGISSGLEKAGYTVERASFDFLLNDCFEGWDAIITNPPFPQKDSFISKCISYKKPFAMLMPLTALEGQKRHALWKTIEYGFGLLVLDNRTEFTGGGVWFNTSWFTFGMFTGVKFAHMEKE